MDREGRSLVQAGQAEVGLDGALEKPAAAEAKRRAMRPDFFQTGPAQNLLARRFEQRTADLAEGWKKSELDELGASGEEPC